MKSALLIAVLLVATASAAAADEPIATQNHAPDGPPPAAPLDVNPQTIAAGRDRKDPDIRRAMTPCGPAKVDETGKVDKTPHGEVWAGVGTQGYREIGGAACIPVGKDAAVMIAVDAGSINGGRRRPR